MNNATFTTQYAHLLCYHTPAPHHNTPTIPQHTRTSPQHSHTTPPHTTTHPHHTTPPPTPHHNTPTPHHTTTHTTPQHHPHLTPHHHPHPSTTHPHVTSLSLAAPRCPCIHDRDLLNTSICNTNILITCIKISTCHVSQSIQYACTYVYYCP